MMCLLHDPEELYTGDIFAPLPDETENISPKNAISDTYCPGCLPASKKNFSYSGANIMTTPAPKPVPSRQSTKLKPSSGTIMEKIRQTSTTSSIPTMETLPHRPSPSMPAARNTRYGNRQSGKKKVPLKIIEISIRPGQGQNEERFPRQIPSSPDSPYARKDNRDSTKKIPLQKRGEKQCLFFVYTAHSLYFKSTCRNPAHTNNNLISC